MRFVKVGAWVFLTLAVLAISVALIGQNTEALSVTLFSYTSSPMPKWALLLGCVFLGAFATSLFFIIELIVLETKSIRYRRQIKLMERALSESGASITGHTNSKSQNNSQNSSASDSLEPKTSYDEEDDLSDV